MIRADRQKGFTLLEVMMALTITGLVLGGLLSLSAGSKRLAVSAQDTLHEAVQRRAAIQFAQLEPREGELESLQRPGRLRFTARSGELMPDPIRRTTPTTWLLQRYELQDGDSDDTLTGSRWIESDVPR
ncbi:MAG: prepilin-type N-terminal cleavage/methylation domain-containing protein [Pseudohongiellaceae bacterium]